MKPMRVAGLFLLLLTLVCATSWRAQCGDKDIAKAERAKREGSWVMTSWDEDGKQLPAEETKKWKMVMKADQFVLFRDGKEVSRGTHKIDVARKPYREDFGVLEGDEKGKAYLGIYAIEGKRFTCCYAEKEQGRPDEFRSGPGKTLVVWEREQR